MNIDDHLLAQLVPLNALPAALRGHIREAAEVLEPAIGDPLFEEGQRDAAAYYVLRGEVALTAAGGSRHTVVAGSAAARHPLAPELPRRVTAEAMGAAVVLRVDRMLLDTCLFWTQADGSVTSHPVLESTRWLDQLAGSPLFARLPADNIQQVLAALEPVHHSAGDTVLHQGEAGDYYYVIEHGRCAVSRQLTGRPEPLRLAELGPGDTFGEEALITGARRNATVTMVTEGALRRLTRRHFEDLIRRPLAREVDATEARRLALEDDALWLDVRLPEEHAKSAIRGSVNVPLARVRAKLPELEKDRRYIVYCDSGRRSAAAAFLMVEYGLDAYHLEGGIMHRPGAADAAGSRLLAASRGAGQRRLELARANRSVAFAARRSAAATALDEAAGQAMERLAAGGEDVDPGLEEGLRGYRERFRDDARATEQALHAAQRRRLDLAAEATILERLSERELAEASDQEEQLRRAAEQRLRAAEQGLQGLYQQVSERLAAAGEELRRLEESAHSEHAALTTAAAEAERRLEELERQRELASAAVGEARAALQDHEHQTAERRKALRGRELELRRQGQEELATARRHLEQELAEVTAELERLRRRREEAAAARRQATAEMERLEAEAGAGQPGSEADAAGMAAVRAQLEVAASEAELRLDAARRARASARAELDDALADDGVAGTDGGDAAVSRKRRALSRAEADVASAETERERVRISREIMDAGEARSEAIEDTLRRRLARELEEWVAREAENESRDRELGNRLYEDLLRAQNEAWAAHQAEEQATFSMMEEIRAQLEAGN